MSSWSLSYSKLLMDTSILLNSSRNKNHHATEKYVHLLQGKQEYKAKHIEAQAQINNIDPHAKGTITNKEGNFRPFSFT